MFSTFAASAQSSELLLNTKWFDYVPIIVFFVFVLGIGFIARRKVSSALDFLLSGRSLPAWVTGLAFVSANLGAVEIMGMSANGAEIGFTTVHYYWIGAIPAMVFLGLVMMPFYYGSKVRSVPEFMLKRFGPAAHLVNSISFALAQLLIAGVNLFLLASIMEALLGWNLGFSLVIAALIVFIYISVGGLSAAIYNEVLQFFIIVAALLPLTLIGLNRIGGWQGMVDKLSAGTGAVPGHQSMLQTWPGQALSGFDSPVWSVIGIIFGLGFVLSFGYWTTNFVEVQRAMASKSITAARNAPIIGSFPKMLIPFIVIVPGMIASVLVPEVIKAHQANDGKFSWNDSLILLMRDVLPNGLLGLAITALLASFMAGMAANISAFNTVWTYDIYETYIKPGKSDKHYIRVGQIATGVAAVVAIFTALIASGYSNVMDYLQTLFGFFNAPLFATFILGMFWKRMTPTAGWVGLSLGTLSAVFIWILSLVHVLVLPGQGISFVAASAAFVVDIVVSVLVSLVTKPKPESELVGFVKSLTPKNMLADVDGKNHPWYQRTPVLASISIILVIVLNVVFR